MAVNKNWFFGSALLLGAVHAVDFFGFGLAAMIEGIPSVGKFILPLAGAVVVILGFMELNK